MHIYCIERPDGLVKVGKSKTPAIRIRSLETSSATEMTRVWVSLQVESGAIETAAHNQLKDLRCYGEWFRVDFDDAVACVSSAIDASRFIGDSWRITARIAMSNRGLTIKDVSDAIKAKRGIVGRLLSGKDPASIEDVYLIANGIGVNPVELIDIKHSDTIGRRIMTARKRAGMSQCQLAKAAGVTQQAISFIEKDRAGASGKVIAIANALGLNSDVLALGKVDDTAEIATILSTLTPPQRAQALRMLEAFAASIKSAN